MREQLSPYQAGSGPIEERIALRLGLQGIATSLDLLRAIEAGFPASVVEIVRRWNIPGHDLAELIVNRRTLQHRLKSGKNDLTPEELDRAARLAKLILLTESTFGNPDKAGRWLETPARAFGGRSPLDMLRTELGAALVEEALYQIDEGMAA